jgi:acyl dehydratase
MTGSPRFAVGDELPPFRRATGLEHWNRYAAVNDEFIPIHMDDEAGRAAGYPSAFGMGNLQIAYLHNLVRQWLGDNGDLLEFGCRFRSANVRNQTVTAKGRITGITAEPGREVLTLEVWTEEQSGHPLAVGHAKVAIPAEPTDSY